jgi:hypothetical protein
MTRAAFYITITLTSDCGWGLEYPKESAQLVAALNDVLGDMPTFKKLTNTKQTSRASVEVEVSQTTPEEITALCVVYVEAKEKATFDKNGFTALLRGALPHVALKVSKRAIAKEELAPIIDDVEGDVELEESSAS